jgi:hypothetical protein
MATWIQTLSAMCIVVLTGWTLKVLRGYAADTKRIADDSASQAERAQIPFVAVSFKEPGGYFMQNQGFGPALNIEWTFSGNGGRVHRNMPSLGVRSERFAHNDISTTLVQQHEPFAIDYQSLSLQRYRTVVTIVDGVTMHSEFRKL